MRHEIFVNGVPTNNACVDRHAGNHAPSCDPERLDASARPVDQATSSASGPSIRPGTCRRGAPWSGATTEASTDGVAPTTPTLLSAASGGNSSCPEELWLRWTAASDDIQPASGIEYEVRVNGVINEVVPGATQTITYTEVLGANTVTIVAVDQGGNASAPSNAQTVITNWAPGGCGL